LSRIWPWLLWITSSPPPLALVCEIAVEGVHPLRLISSWDVVTVAAGAVTRLVGLVE
jgi:hypothetical protein